MDRRSKSLFKVSELHVPDQNGRRVHKFKQKETSVFHGPVSFDPVKMSTQK